ncbi:MAG: hypothetical protein ACE5HI_01045 [bacterium]
MDDNQVAESVSDEQALEDELDAFAAEEDTGNLTTQNVEPQETITSTESTSEESTSEESVEAVPEAQPDKFADLPKEDVIKSYTELESKLGQQGIELGQYRQEVEKLKTELEALQETVKPAQEDKQESEEVSSAWTQEQIDEYNRLYVEEEPAQAEIYAHKIWEEVHQAKQIEAQVEHLKSEAEEFNRNLALGRAKELLYQEAKTRGDKDAMDKFADKSYLPSIEEIEKNNQVYNQFLKEAEYVTSYFKRQDLTIGDKTVYGAGKYFPNAFEEARKALQYEKDIVKTKVDTAEQTAQVIQQENQNRTAELIPSGSDKHEAGVTFTGQEDVAEAARKWEQVDPDKLEADIDNEF